MLVPIAINGVLIFAFQSFIQVKLNKNIRINERKNTIVDELEEVRGCVRDKISKAIRT